LVSNISTFLEDYRELDGFNARSLFCTKRGDHTTEMLTVVS
jgi:hypothetical protein